MSIDKFTDEDLQNYLDGTFSGDVNNLEKYIQDNETVQKQVDLYKLVIRTLETQKQPALSFDLSHSLLLKIEKRKRIAQKKKTPIWNWGLIASAILAVIVVGRFLQIDAFFRKIDDPFFFSALVVICFGSVLFFHFSELTIRRKIFKS